MKINLDDFRRHFELLSDQALLATERDDLVGPAQQCYDEEVARRSLNHPAEAGEAVGGEAAPAVADHTGEELVSLSDAVAAGEMGLARGLLESAGIPCIVTNEYTGLGGFQLDLKVPASMVEHALDVLGGEISEEELAAQAEAAGEFDEMESKPSEE